MHAMGTSTAGRTGLANLTPTLPRLAPVRRRAFTSLCAGIPPRAAVWLARVVVWRTFRNLRQQSQQRTGDSDRLRIAQRGAGAAMTFHFRGALMAKRNVMGRPQVRVHPQLAVDKRGDGLNGQMLGRTELPRCANRRVALRRELRREPGERSAEHMSPLDHHQLLSGIGVCLRALFRM